MGNKKSLIVTPEIFKTYGTEQKLNTLFHYVYTLHNNSCAQGRATDDRLDALERRKLVDKGVAIGSGGVGGFAFMAVKWFMTKVLS